MDLLSTLAIYFSMLYVSSVQGAVLPEEIPSLSSTIPPAIVETHTMPELTPGPTITAFTTPMPTPNITPNKAYSTLQMGDRGDEVLKCQTALKNYGYYDGELDGSYGNQTRNAVIRFQTSHGLVADGFAGSSTLTVLYEYKQVHQLSTKAPEPTPTPEPINMLKPALTPSPSPIQTAVTATNQPTESLAPKGTTIAPATNAPSEINMLEDFSIVVDNLHTLISTSADSNEKVLSPLLVNDSQYIPLKKLLIASEVMIIESEGTSDSIEYAFAYNNQICRVVYDSTDEKNHYVISVFFDGIPQVISNRDVYYSFNEDYVSLETLNQIFGFTFQLDNETKQLNVTSSIPVL